MSKERENIPQADTLMGSMRSMGYSFETALADVVDNSISANATTIRILFPTNPMDVRPSNLWSYGHTLLGRTDIHPNTVRPHG